MAVFGNKRHVAKCSRWAVPSLLLLAACAGCTTGAYNVSNLPVQYLAPSPQNVETANLGGLANTSISSEVIQPGDVLEVTMMTDYSKLTVGSTPVRVANDGSIVVPLIGRVAVAGYELEQAEQILANESVARGVYRTPNITVTMKQPRVNKVTVVGAVNKPGTIELPRGSSSLLGALVAVEGLSKEAGPEVEIRRTDVRGLSRDANPSGVMPASYQQNGQMATAQPTVERIDLTEASKQGAIRSPDLRDGDVVYVPKKVMKPVYVLGLVKKAGEYPFPVSQELRLMDAIALAGGFSTPLAEKILVIREAPNRKEPIRIAVNVLEAQHGNENLALAPGDTVTVEYTPIAAVGDMIQTFFRVGIGTSVSLF
jgi:polysaccharide export outer membrane protein